jgi:cytochrome c biogenesis protein CcdA/glutaredoxin
MKNKIFFLSIFIFFLSLFFPKEILATGKIEIYFFWGQGCPHCAVEKPFLEELKQKYPQLEVKDFEVYYSRENLELFQRVAQAYKTQAQGVPTTFIGKDFIVGFGTKETTGKQIENLIQNCLTTICPSPEEILSAGGIDKWKPKEEEPPKEEPKEEPKKESKICIHYFVKDECPQCQNLESFLQDIAKKYEIDFKIYNVSESEENLKLYQKLQDFYGISFSGFPIVFLGDTYLVGDESIKDNVEKVILRCQKDGCPCPVEKIKQTLTQIPKPSTFTPEEKKEISIMLFGKEIKISSQSSLFLLGVILGLAEGINPCMLSVLLFLLTYILAIGSKERAVKIGLVYVLSVFVVFFLFLLGLLKIISLITFISKIKIVIAIFTFIVSLILIKEFFAYGKWISLEIPESTKPWIEKLIKRVTISSAILLGVLASMVELPCTVGIPLIYITILAEKSKIFHIPYIIWFSFFVIFPLLIIIGGVAFAFTQVEKIEKWRLNFRKYARLIAGLFMLFLSIALFKGWM